MLRHKLLGSVTYGAISSLALAYPALAQTNDAQTPSALAEIVVTAQRRAQNIQDVPVSVTAFRGEELMQIGVRTVQDLAKVDSSLETSYQANAFTTFLRGTGNSSAITAGNEASVPVYIDDVYYTRLYATYMALANIDRVEVLKGPQGTLFGRNSSGGLIQIFTREPSKSDVGFDATLGYGNYGTYTGKLYASTPLSSDAAIDISIAGLKQNDGWGTNFADGSPTYRDQYYNIRSKLVADLTPTTHVRLIGFYAHQDNTVGSAGGAVYNGFTRGLPPNYTQQFIPRGGFYDLDTDLPTLTRNTGYGASLKVEQEVGFADFVSISSWRRSHELFQSEGDMTNVNWLHYQLYLKDREITQEFQLKSRASSKIAWLLGAYYLNSRQGYEPTRIFGGAITGGGFLDNLYYSGLQTINSYAGFAQATVPVVDERTNFTLGFRYTVDKVKGHGETAGQLAGNGPVIALAPDYDQAVKFTKPTFRAGIDHKFSDNVMAYLSFNRGYKSGTFNTLPLNAPPTKPEVVDAYEVGIKSELFDRRLRLNAAVFQNDITDPQVELFRTVAGVAAVEFANAGKARTKGVDFDSTAIVMPGLELRFSGQYLSAKYLDFKNAPFNIPLFTPPYGLTTVIGDASGKQMPYAPKWKFNAGLNYELGTSVGSFDFDLNVAYRSDINYDPDNVIAEPKLTLINSGLTYSPESNKKLSIRGWVSNLTGKKYYMYEAPVTGPVGFITAPGAPRTYGLEVRFKL